MPQCEMCGAEKPSLTTTKVEGAELELCDECSEFGTEVKTQSPSSTSTKYSTSSDSSDSGGASSSSGGSSGDSSTRRHDLFDEMEEVANDYDDRIRKAREEREISQEDLAQQLNEKASLIRKLEGGGVLPSDQVQQKIESELDISLSAGSDEEDAEWSGGSSTTTTLGDVVKRKD